MKKLLALVLLITCLALPLSGAAQEQAPTFFNPIPQIVRAVRPSVVSVVAYVSDWSPETDVITRKYGSGTGVYIDEAGYILTNNHVIESADVVKVQVLGGEEKEATIVGGDPGTDLALIKIDWPMDASPVPLGDSDELELGELVVMIGNPGVGNGATMPGSVTAGIVSSLGHVETGAGNFTRPVELIQTDAAQNTGNSGGALLNTKGELVGVPTLKYVASMDAIYEGLGFAIPINLAKPVIEQLKTKGKVVRPRMGVTVVDVIGPDEPLKRYAPAGVQVVSVEPNTPATAAGLLPYDIILSLNEVRTDTTMKLLGELDKHQPGDTVTLEICRYYDSMTGQPLVKYTCLKVSLPIEMLD